MKNTRPVSHRIAALLMSMMLLVFSLPITGFPEEIQPWEMAVLTVSYGTDFPVSQVAQPVSWNKAAKVFWVQLDAAAPLDALTLTVDLSLVDPNFTTEYTAGAMLPPVMEAYTVDDFNGIDIPVVLASDPNQVVDLYRLLISRQPMPEPTAEPTPEPLASGTVNVQYVDQFGTPFAWDSLDMSEGTATVSVNYGLIPSPYYTLTDAETKTVTLNHDGSFSENPITFWFNYAEPPPEPPASGTVNVQYVDQNGTAFAWDFLDMVEGTATVSVNYGLISRIVAMSFCEPRS